MAAHPVYDSGEVSITAQDTWATLESVGRGKAIVYTIRGSGSTIVAQMQIDGTNWIQIIDDLAALALGGTLDVTQIEGTAWRIGVPSGGFSAGPVHVRLYA